MRDIESLCDKAGLGKLSKSTASRICSGANASASRQFKRRDLYEVHLAALVRWTRCSCRSGPMGPRRACSSPGASPRRASACFCRVMLGMRESHEDWLALGRDLIARGLGAPLLDSRRRRAGADQGGRAVLAGLRPPALRRSSRAQPAGEAARARARARAEAPTGKRLTRRINEKDGRQRLKALVGELDKAGYTAGGEVSERGPRRPGRAPALPDQTPPALALDEPARAIAR